MSASLKFLRTFLYYTHFLPNIYWHFIQIADKISKTHYNLSIIEDAS